MTVYEYICNNIDKTVRLNEEDEGTLYGLPYSYTVPCAADHFNELYYWDTYFINKGLLLIGREELAKNNVRNFAYEVERFDFVLNGNRTYYRHGTQPPYFTMMAYDVYQATGDKEFLKEVYPSIKKEHDFWTNLRMAENGLNIMDIHMATDEELSYYYLSYLPKRIKIDTERDPVYAGRCYKAEGQTGWDFSPRFFGYGVEYNPIDLNALLYASEKACAFFERELGLSDGKVWEERAEKRAKLINELCWDEKEGVYTDYSYVKKQTGIVSAAGFQAYSCGVAPKARAQGALNLLKQLEQEHAVACTLPCDEVYQWAYPNAWAPLQLLTVDGLHNYGFVEDARRIAEKYVAMIDENFARTGKIFEKYNAVTGKTDVASEYGNYEMLGWTAGVYLYMQDYLRRTEK